MSNKFIYLCLGTIALIIAVLVLNIPVNEDGESLNEASVVESTEPPSIDINNSEIINATADALRAIDDELMTVTPDDRQPLDCKTTECFIATATEGSTSKQLSDLGWLLYRIGGAQNAELAIHWSTQAADQGDLDAQALLADIYFQGQGTPQDVNLAYKYAKSASDQGQLNGSYTLAWLSFAGLGTEKSETQAFNIYKAAADQGHIPSQSAVGWMYQTGRGVEKNIENALKWYKIASDAGNHDAMVAAASLYYYGEETQKDEQYGLWLFEQAAAQGNAEAIEWIKQNTENKNP